jgi:hypothetical protein
MSFARVAAIAVAASLFWWGGSAYAAGPLRAFHVGLWSGGAYIDDRTGGFTHCSAGVAYDSGINMFVLVTGGYRWWLGFINPKWSLTPDVHLPVELRVDKGAPFARVAIVPSGQLLLVLLPDNSRLIDAFRHSSELSLVAERETFFFKLSDTSAVMDKLTGCVRISVALETRAPSPPPTSASASSATKEPATGDGALSETSSPAAIGTSRVSRRFAGAGDAGTTRDFAELGGRNPALTCGAAGSRLGRPGGARIARYAPVLGFYGVRDAGPTRHGVGSKRAERCGRAAILGSGFGHPGS